MANIPHLKTNGLKLKPEFKAAWLEALWSGRYEQARHYMRNDMLGPDGNFVRFGYCCIGVAADVSVLGGDCPIQWGEKKGGGGYYFGAHSGLLTVAETNQLGWFEGEDEGSIRSILGQLADANDSGRYTFTEIGMAIAIYL